MAVNGSDATRRRHTIFKCDGVPDVSSPDLPEPGAVNVTFTPLTGLFPASFTVTASALANAVLIVADCGVVPAFAAIVVAAPAVFVSAKVAGDPKRTPLTSSHT